jgi:hypothetical protein
MGERNQHAHGVIILDVPIHESRNHLHNLCAFDKAASPKIVCNVSCFSEAVIPSLRQKLKQIL